MASLACAFFERSTAIAGLVAQGRSNPQIAKALGLSPWTVKDRVDGLLAMAEVENRTQFAVWWVLHYRWHSHRPSDRGGISDGALPQPDELYGVRQGG